MASLIATWPAAGLLPLTIGGIDLTEADIGPVTQIAPFHGRMEAVAEVLQTTCGFGFPEPNRMLSRDEDSILWIGPDRALLIGGDPPASLEGLASLTDQSDAMVVVRIHGAGATEVLARLVPVDLRPGRFPPGQTARTQVGHMTASVTCLKPDLFEVMAMRSMAATLVHELETAARGVAARG